MVVGVSCGYVAKGEEGSQETTVFSSLTAPLSYPAQS